MEINYQYNRKLPAISVHINLKDAQVGRTVFTA